MDNKTLRGVSMKPTFNFVWRNYGSYLEECYIGRERVGRIHDHFGGGIWCYRGETQIHDAPDRIKARASVELAFTKWYIKIGKVDEKNIELLRSNLKYFIDQRNDASAYMRIYRRRIVLTRSELREAILALKKGKKVVK